MILEYIGDKPYNDPRFVAVKGDLINFVDEEAIKLLGDSPDKFKNYVEVKENGISGESGSDI